MVHINFQLQEIHVLIYLPLLFFKDELWDPTIILEVAGGTYVDQSALDFVKEDV